MEANLKTTNAGFKNILLRKLSCAVIASIISQVLLLFLFLFIINLDFLQPWKVKNFFEIISSFYTWIYFIPFTSVIFAHSVICAKDYVLVVNNSQSRFSKFLAKFSIHNLILLGLHIASGGLITWLYLQLGTSNAHPCNLNESCIMEGKLYLILNGFFNGLYYFLNLYRTDKKINFPVVHQRKTRQFKTQLLNLISKCKNDAIFPTASFIVIYYLTGDVLRCRLDLKIKNEQLLFVYFYSWVLTSLYFIKLRVMSLFFELFLTEPLFFPIETCEKNDYLTLSNALNVKNIPIIQFLACYDLYMLSFWCENRRKIIYSVSQPGGHPNNWNTLITQLLTILNEYTLNLNKSSGSIIEKNLPKIDVCQIKSPVPHKNLNLRNMTYIEPDPLQLDIVSIQRGNMSLIGNLNDTVGDKFSFKLNKYLNVFKEKCGFNFLFGEIPELSVRNCLFNAQIVIWTSQALASLLVFAINEDTYGVVQKDLPVIISTLYELKLAVEKLNRLPNLNKRNTSDDFYVKTKIALNSAVKRSLFNICRAYGPYLKDLNLKKDVYQYVCSSKS